MSPTWTTNKTIEFKGVNFVSTIVNDSGCIFDKRDGSTDVGIDGYIEFVENQRPTGLTIGVQIKSGDSNLSADSSKIYFKSDQSHFAYWNSCVLDIVGIVYIPSENQAYWINIKAYLEANPAIIKRGPFQIPIDKSNIFSVKTFRDFHNHFTTYTFLKNKVDEEVHFGKTLKLFASDNRWQRFEGIKSLFYYHRNEKATWFYLLKQLGSEEDYFIQHHLIRMFIHLVPEGDIWLHAGNVINEYIEKYAKDIIKKTYGVKEIKILLHHIHENGFNRGSIGRHFPALIDLIPDRIEYLKKIILDRETDSKTRFFAAVLIIYDLQFYDLERGINFAQSMISNFPDDLDDSERFQGIKEMLEQGIFLNIY
ncbi:MAG: DUF4365 domain-containing protein [Sporocytophaga sp.]|nr:DUF4365 domain-containing protein [Sporocytophaga sp.]